MFEVNDTRNDERVPQDLVLRYGIAAYLGAPVLIRGEAVGAMCAIDFKPRMFTAYERETIVRMAAAASRRLELLAAQPREREPALLDNAVRPAFSELRNRLTPVLGNISLMQVALSELAAVQRLARHMAETGDISKISLLSRGAEAFDELQESLEDLASDTQAIARGIVALERASIGSSNGCLLDDVIEAATTLAHHRTKLVGGVRRPEARHCTLQTPRPIAITALAAALTELAETLSHQRGSHGITIIVTQGECELRVQLVAAVDAMVYPTISQHLRLLLADTNVVVGASAAGIDIVYPMQARRIVSPHGSRLHGVDRTSA